MRYAHKRFRQAVNRWRQRGSGPITIVRPYLRKNRARPVAVSTEGGWEKCYDEVKQEWFWRHQTSGIRRSTNPIQKPKGTGRTLQSAAVHEHKDGHKCKHSSCCNHDHKDKTVHKNHAASVTAANLSTKLREQIANARAELANIDFETQRAHAQAKSADAPEPTSADTNQALVRRRRADILAKAAERRSQEGVNLTSRRVIVVADDGTKPKPAPPPGLPKRNAARMISDPSRATCSSARTRTDTPGVSKIAQRRAAAAAAARRARVQATEQQQSTYPLENGNIGAGTVISRRRMAMSQTHGMSQPSAGRAPPSAQEHKRNRMLAAAAARADAAQMPSETTQWVQKWDEQHQAYYWLNTSTGESQWA